MTLRPQILAAARAADKPLTMTQLFLAIDGRNTGYAAFAVIVSEMVSSGELEKVDAPPHSGSGVRSAYVAGRVT